MARLEIDGIQDVTNPREDGDVSNWQKALRWCPQELVELINSKACRGMVVLLTVFIGDADALGVRCYHVQRHADTPAMRSTSCETLRDRPTLPVRAREVSVKRAYCVREGTQTWCLKAFIGSVG